ncbi:hypothetical protein SDC9_12673 [bioreactor metagenome]|uniref:SHOCT domain-containing protein n=1 Tax=bioreactor metagenome TaxID=1076179 RepID=A0A644TJB2_9ZZZZ|nr:SHOCT domain-containing protein [Desulfovibrio desulfuricans]MEA4990901.1 SHOCT domain-containing protein [Desulfovibrio desulfuricans]
MLQDFTHLGTAFAYTASNGAEIRSTNQKTNNKLTAQRHIEDTDMYGCDIGSVMGWGNGMTHLIFMILIISLAVAFISRIFPSQRKNMDYTDSMAILKRRLASGEITLEEYEKLKKSI